MSGVFQRRHVPAPSVTLTRRCAGQWVDPESSHDVGRSRVNYSRTGILLAAALTAVALTNTPAYASKKVVVTPSETSGIVAHDYALNNDSNATLSYSVQAQHEQGTALAIDDAAFRGVKLAGFRTLDGAHYYPFTGSIVSSALPAQSTYPVQFAVLARQHSSAGTPAASAICAKSGSLLVERKDTAASAWRITLEPYVPIVSALPKFQLRPTGFGQSITSSDAPALATLPAIFVSDLNNRAETNSGGALLPVSVYATGCEHLAMVDPHNYVGMKNGFTLSFSAATLAPSDLAIYATVGGGALALFTVRENLSERPTVAGEYVVWPHHTTLATSVFNLLPAGHYGTVSWEIDQQVAIALPSTTSTANARVVGNDWGIVSVKGTPVH
jgi:hypothetical protein